MTHHERSRGVQDPSVHLALIAAVDVDVRIGGCLLSGVHARARDATGFLAHGDGDEATHGVGSVPGIRPRGDEVRLVVVLGRDARLRRVRARVEQVVEHAHALGAVPLGRAGVDRARGGATSASAAPASASRREVTPGAGRRARPRRASDRHPAIWRDGRGTDERRRRRKPRRTTSA